MLKKFFFILLFILFFLILFNIDLFAADVTFTNQNGTEITTSLPDSFTNNNFCIVQLRDSIFAINFNSSTNYRLELYFDTISIYVYYYYSTGNRGNYKIYNYDSSSNTFNLQSNTVAFGDGSINPSTDFNVLYCSKDVFVICAHDNGNHFADNEILGYYSAYNLNVSYEEFNSYFRIFTNYFSNSGVQGFWTPYIFTLPYENYKPLEQCDPIAGSGWESFDNCEFSDDGSIRYYYDVTTTMRYIICFENVLIDTYKYFVVDLSNIDFLNLHLSTIEQTTEPIYVLSNRYYYEGEYDASDDFLNNYDLDVSYGYDETFGYAPLSVTGFDEEKQMYYTEYQFKIVVNGIYTFKILNFNTQEITYQTFNVDNIGIDNKWGDDVFYDNYNDDGKFDPTPALFLEYVDTTTVRIRTQPFSFNEIIMLKCFTQFEDGDFSQNRNIYNYTIDTGNTIYDDDGIKQNNIDLYYFYLDVQVDGNYTFQFYNIELNKYTESSIYVDISEFIIGNIDNIDSFSDKMIAWSRLHFGFLVYPFELAINIFGRVTNINLSEPVLTIPELKSPFDGTVFFSGVDFNFNNILDIGVVNTIYNIYLVVVDAIFIFLFVSLCKKVFGEVFK